MNNEDLGFMLVIAEATPAPAGLGIFENGEANVVANVS
jgi:hypothetical protein